MFSKWGQRGNGSGSLADCPGFVVDMDETLSNAEVQNPVVSHP